MLLVPVFAYVLGDIKRAGILHMIHTVTGEFDYPIALQADFDIQSCLNCHAGAA